MSNAYHFHIINRLLYRFVSNPARSFANLREGSFGHLSQRGRKDLDVLAAQNYAPDDQDNYDKQEVDKSPRKNEFYYKYEITNNARKGRIGLKKALELFHQMKSRDRLTPHFNHFSVLIYGCAKAGLTRRAFELYNEGLKYFKKPSEAMITCLINACAECPFPDYGLKRLDWLRTHLRTQYNWKMTDIQYNCAIKAYGKLGKLDQAAKLIQEMLEDGIHPSSSTFNMLLIGCSSDKDSGALVALRMYKLMRLYGIKPDNQTYFTLLGCIQYCSMGSPSLLQDTLKELPAMTTFDHRLAYKAFKKKQSTRKALKEFEWLPSILELGTKVEAATHIRPEENNHETKLIQSGNDLRTSLITTTNVEEYHGVISLPKSNSPNLLSDDHLTLINQIAGIHFEKLNKSFFRFQLFGGADGFLEVMKRDECEPDIKLFTRLCSLVMPNRLGLLQLYHLVKEHQVDRDEFFYNALIKSACLGVQNTRRLDLALSFMDEMHRDNIRPNIATFEALACGCDHPDQAAKLIRDIKRCGFTLSYTIIESLFRRACSKKDFDYLVYLIKHFRNSKFEPTKELLELLEATKVSAYSTILKHEQGSLGHSDLPVWLTEENISKYDQFRATMDAWLKKVPVQSEDHPWQYLEEEKGTKRQGFVDFVRDFKALERVKHEAIKRGDGFGNLYAKVDRVNERPRIKSGER